MMDNQSLTIKRITLLCVMCFIASFLVVAPGAALHDVSVSIDQPGGVCMPAEKCIIFTIDMGMNQDVNAFLISFPNDDVSVPSFIDPECVNISWRSNGVWTAPVHPEDLEINETFAGHQLPPNSTTVKIWTPIDIPTNKEVLICFLPCSGINMTSCEFSAWVSTDLENTPVESENTASLQYSVEAEGSEGGEITPVGETLYDCGDTPTYYIDADEDWEICDVCVEQLGGNDPCFGRNSSYVPGIGNYTYIDSQHATFKFDPLYHCYEIDAYFCNTSISGYKLNAWDNTTGLAGWKITLANSTLIPGGMTCITDTSGFFRFNKLPFGIYQLNETPQSGWIQVTANRTVEINSTNPHSSQNFANSGKVPINGYKHDDLGNPLSGWDINLFDEMGLIMTYETGPDGYYQFYLPFGAYEVDETIQPGWTLIYPEGGYYEVEANETNYNNFSNLNFTNKINKIIGYKLDSKGNGLSGWEMTLSNETSVVNDTATNESGFYNFSYLPYGIYTVTEELKECYVNITPLSQDNLIIDDETPVIEDVNFINELIVSGNISGYKLDNTTGLGIPGWEMELYAGTTDIDYTETNESGFYIFNNLSCGTYTVEEDMEPGWRNVTNLSVRNLTINATNLVIGNVNFTNEWIVGNRTIIGWVASHCNIGSLSLPGVKVCVALTPEDLGTDDEWCNTTDERGLYYITGLPTGVPLYAMATAPGYEQRPISYQINTGHVIICNDFSTTPRIPALVVENTTQVNWFLVKNPFFSFFPFF